MLVVPSPRNYYFFFIMTSRTATAAQRANAARKRRASSSKEGAFAHVYSRSSTESLQVNTWKLESGMALAAATHFASARSQVTATNKARKLLSKQGFQGLQGTAKRKRKRKRSRVEGTYQIDPRGFN